MVLSSHGFLYYPSTLNTALNNLGGNGYDGSGYVEWSAVSFLSGGALEYTPGNGTTTQVDADLCNGNPVILGVNGNGHFVVAIGKTDGEYDIIPPRAYRRRFALVLRQHVPSGTRLFILLRIWRIHCVC